MLSTRSDRQSFWPEFRKFLLKGNVIELAIGVVIGAAFAKIISSLVNDVLMPLINPFVPGGNWRNLEIGPAVKIGSFIGSVLDFLVISFVIFLVIRAIGRVKVREQHTVDSSDLPD